MVSSSSFSILHTDLWLVKAIRELQEELHTEIYPGTEIMTDIGTHHFVKMSGGAQDVLVPQPSDDEHDPLVSSSWLVI